MTKFLRFAAAAALAAAPYAALKAQEAPMTFELHLGYLGMDTGNDMKAMRDGTGYSLGVALPINLSDSAALRLYLSSVFFDGIQGSGLTAQRPNMMFGMEVKKQLWNKLSVFGGPFGMKWNQNILAATDVRFANNAATYNSDLGTGVKLGARVGLDYEINDMFLVHAYWTVAEANRRFSPSWLTIGGAVRF